MARQVEATTQDRTHIREMNNQSPPKSLLEPSKQELAGSQDIRKARRQPTSVCVTGVDIHGMVVTPRDSTIARVLTAERESKEESANRHLHGQPSRLQAVAKGPPFPFRKQSSQDLVTDIQPWEMESVEQNHRSTR